MILVDLYDSYQNIPKSPHIAWKKVPFLWDQNSKSGFFSFAPKKHLDQSKIGTINMCAYYSSRAIRTSII
jgi:hypothetical protein